MTVEPFTLLAGELVLDALTDADIPRITEYCQDPAFERFLTIPWPYDRDDAEFFVREIAQAGWESGQELTWAIRLDGALLGVVSVRKASTMIGYWIGAEHRGRGYMSRAVRAVIDWVFESGWSDIVRWEARLGNMASLSVARKLGFQYVDIGPAFTAARDGTSPPSWRAELHLGDDRSVKSGWPPAPTEEEIRAAESA